jgi:hypothetical protein
MELGSPEALGELMRLAGNPPPVERTVNPIKHHAPVQSVAGPVSKGKKLRCKCGLCRQCLDDARWERVYTEKFADPHYYDRPITRYGSPLASW